METKNPKKWKMVVITWIAIVPLIFSIPPFLQPKLMALGLNSFPSELIAITILVILMVYAALPLLMKLFGKWLNK